MMNRMTSGMIDLDRVAERTEPVAPRRPTAGGLRIAAVLLLVLALLGPAEPPPAGLRLVLAANGTAAAAFTLGSGALYTASYGVGNPNNESGVRRFDLAGGSLRWATALPQGVQNLVVADGAGVLLARSGTAPEATFLDSGTGAVLWETDAANTSVLRLAHNGVLLLTDRPDDAHLRLAEPRTGRTIWTRRVERGGQFGPDALWSGEARRIVVVGHSGAVLLLDFATGAVLSSGSTGEPLTPIADDSIQIGHIGDDHLVIRNRDTLTVYALVPFRRVWRRTADRVGFMVDCGRLWCLTEAAGNAVRGIDPAGGTPRWTAPGLPYAARWTDDLLLAYDRDAEPNATLLDAGTGRVVRRLGPIFEVDGLLMRPDVRERGQAWVAGPDARGVLRTMGRVDTTVPYGCEARDRYVACPTLDGPTKVWRVPD
jgi:outer membrane protein assembly factor BamB